MNIDAHPILSCSAATEYETAYFDSGLGAEGPMMYRAGRAIAAAIEDDFEEISGFPAEGKAIVLAGKGHNSGDALICANSLLDRHPDLEVLVLVAFPFESFRKKVSPPFELLRARSDIRQITEDDDVTEIICQFAGDRCIDLCIDGLFGMQGRPPLRGIPLKIVSAINQFHSIRFRAAVDLPSGIGGESDEVAFHADFTYATGITKTPVTEERFLSKVGRLRYLDLGFFHPRPDLDPGTSILRESILWQLASLRKPETYKRTFGHLLILAGSDQMPGACKMASMAAANSGCGLITIGTVESVARSGVVSLPEAMWSTVPADEGFLHTGILEQLSERMHDFSAVLIGPGLGRTASAKELIHRVVTSVEKPIVIDADALVPEICAFLQERPHHFPQVVLTPHGGEWKRIGGKPFDDDGAAALQDFCSANHCIVILKGPRTRIADHANVYLSPFGGPVLARGGTGDLLAGMVGSLLAQNTNDPTTSAAMATVWHGRAADCMARAQGNWAVRTTQLIDYFPDALGFKR